MLNEDWTWVRNNPAKVIIAGSRHMPFSMFPLVGQAVKKSRFCVAEVVCGMNPGKGKNPGADKLGAKWAVLNKIPVTPFYPDWDNLGPPAGPIRNLEMARYADAAIIFIWDGSRGSEDMRRKMMLLRKPVFTVYNGEIDYAF